MVPLVVALSGAGGGGLPVQVTTVGTEGTPVLLLCPEEQCWGRAKGWGLHCAASLRGQTLCLLGADAGPPLPDSREETSGAWR